MRLITSAILPLPPPSPLSLSLSGPSLALAPPPPVSNSRDSMPPLNQFPHQLKRDNSRSAALESGKMESMSAKKGGSTCYQLPPPLPPASTCSILQSCLQSLADPIRFAGAVPAAASSDVVGWTPPSNRIHIVIKLIRSVNGRVWILPGWVLISVMLLLLLWFSDGDDDEVVDPFFGICFCLFCLSDSIFSPFCWID